MAFLSLEQIQSMGFSHVGINPKLSEKASFYNCSGICLGDNVRIDDFSIISAGVSGIEIGNHVHVASHCVVVGAGKISIQDFVGISSRVSVYSSTDDFSGAAMTGPTVPSEYTNVKSADVALKRHVVVGSGSVIMPGVTLEEGVAVGAMSLVTSNCEAFGIYFGVPARRMSSRKRNLLVMERKFRNSMPPQNAGNNYDVSSD